MYDIPSYAIRLYDVAALLQYIGALNLGPSQRTLKNKTQSALIL